MNTPSLTRAPGPRIALALACAALLAGCTVAPKALTQDEVRERVLQDTARMYSGQAPITAAITMEEAVARALKYNLDYRLKKMESALAQGLANHTRYDMLPQLVASAGYNERSNDSGGTSIGLLDGAASSNPTRSDERRHHTRGIEFSWNALDFGVSYYRARQQGDQFLISEERRRKVVQNMLQDVRAAYWRALGAQRLNAQADEVLQKASLALARSREAETQKIIPPGVALAYQRALLDATVLLNQRRQDLEFAKRELAALMNVPPGVDFQVAEADEVALPAAPKDVTQLEDMALLQRPELREEDLRRRITADEARKQMLALLPGISFSYGRQFDSNRFLYNNSWSEGGLSLAWNLMRLVSVPAMKNAQAYQAQTDEARRMALSMAILTQARVSAERYRMALEDFKLADQAAQVDTRLAAFTRASVSARLESELEAIRTQARAVLGAYQRANAYANAHIAFGRLYNTLGFDPIADDFEGNDLPQLTERVRAHLRATQENAFVMSSNLFGPAPHSVGLAVTGDVAPGDVTPLTTLTADFLQRQDMGHNGSEPATLTLDLQRQQAGDLEKATWTLSLSNAQGEVLRRSRFDTTVPREARAGIHQKTLLAALTAHLGTLREWLHAE
ncbi:outer membrane protein [Hydrogenophaga taeniospiralis CCUG 15921]|uniref:Outer membrane protein n=1 Tax=Hydrogenophaga taeniospiralis CCUG 15921 TaxID=1281780 RepID=A0A9X4NY66_9BURK|nr:TolC family protein [Hydrogenophaga taeniospiralis]MDG5978444.1 outer membrane protein [Hydrogenophaga taeniospiralis CCUG 15921]